MRGIKARGLCSQAKDYLDLKTSGFTDKIKETVSKLHLGTSPNEPADLLCNVFTLIRVFD